MSKIYNILAVDDVEDWLIYYNKLLFEMFKNYKYSFEESAQKGLKTATKNVNYDLVISDLEMEHISDECCAGEWMLQHLVNKKGFENTKFIIISARYDIEDIAKKLKVDYIPKNLLLSSPILFKYKVTEVLNLLE
jgi:CheY-like chemotaxis protein